MVARAVGQLAVVDEDGRAAVLRHQRVGQRQRRMRDVGAADVEGPGHRMANPTAPARRRRALRSRSRMRLSFSASISPANCGPWIATGAERRRRALGPHRVDRIALDRDQFGAGLGAGGGQPLGCRRSVQPGVKTEAVAGCEMLGQPVFRRRIDQRLDLPGLAVDLLGGLQRVAAVDEHGGLRVSTIAMPAEPVKPVSQASRSSEGGDIFVLLLIGAGNHESGELAPRQFLAECGEPRGQRDAAFGLFECLEMGFEHRWYFRVTVESPQCGRIAIIWHNPCLNFTSALDRTERFAVQTVAIRIPGDFQECLNSTTRGYTMPAFTFEKISPPVAAARFRRSPTRSGAASSSRCWTVSSKRASSAPAERRKGRHRPRQTARNEILTRLRSNRLLQPSMRRCRSGTSPRAR